MSFFRKLMGKSSTRGEPVVEPIVLPEAGEGDEGSADQDRIILCIPGPWQNRSEFIQAVARASLPDAAYLAAGMIMIHGPSKAMFEFDFCESDDLMAEAFTAAGSVNQIDRDVVNQIAEHESVVYLLSTVEQSPETSIAIARAAAHLIKAGGFGVKVETAGIAFSAAQWLAATEGEFIEIYRLMVLDSITDNDTTYSCGMRNLGLPDAIVSGEEFQSAVQLIRALNRYQLYEHPTLAAGHTFSPDEHTPRFSLSDEEEQPYGDNDTYFNQYGMWRLRRADTAH